MAALAHGLPSLLLPLGADQPHNAKRASELGLAATLDPARCDATAVASAVRAALADTAMRDRCRAVAERVRALPDVTTAVAALEAAAHAGR